MPQGTVSHYRIIEYLGGGAMGKVYLAEDTLLRRKVALKFLPAVLTGDEEASRRFMTEARTASSLDHRHICTIHEIARTDEGERFIAMSYYEGQTLKSLLADRDIEPDRALKIARQVALGLAAAHEKGVIHRDIKPANIMITERGQVKILDFGLARLVGHSRQTRTGTIMGTAAYMSPEQGRGEVAGPSSDIWSLGIVLYEMLAGEIPFRGETEVALIYSIINQDPAPLPADGFKAATVCARILERCLEKNPDQRYPSAKVLAEDLEVAHSKESSTRKSRTSRRSISIKSHRLRGFLVGATVVALLAAVGLGFPEQREAFLEFLGFGGEPPSVAVLPFRLSGEGDEAKALGVGLGMSVSDRLTELESSGARLWVIPQSDIRLALVPDRDLAVRRLAADFVVTAEGTFDGRNLDIEISLFDRATGSEKNKDFHDSYGNLQTWQAGLASWVARQIDPKLTVELPDAPGIGCTTVPEAFLAFNRGRGQLAIAETEPSERKERLDQATASFSAAIAADSSYACAWTGLGNSFAADQRLGGESQYRKAAVCLERATRLSPHLVQAYLGLARIHYDHRDSSATMEYASLALEVRPGNLPALYALGAASSRFGNTDAAAGYYARAANKRPSYPMGHKAAGLYHYYRREIDQTIGYWEKVVELTPDDHFGFNILGAALFAQERWPEAGEQFRKSLEIEPSVTTYSNLGTINYYEGRYMDSIEAYRQSIALQTTPDYAVYQHMAEAFRWAPGHEDSATVYFGIALEMLEVVLAGDPDDQSLLVDRASYTTNLGRQDEARKILDDLVTRTDLIAHTMFTMATVFEELGERERAFIWLEKSLAAGQPPMLVDVYPILRNLRSTDRYQSMIADYAHR